MSEDIAIKVAHVSKEFKLPHERQTSIKGAVINLAKSGRRNRSYEKQQVLKDISFEIKKGEFFGIVGRNGSGKSTLLKMLAGIYSPNGGSIQINGKLTPFIELGVGFNPELTGRENVFLNGALLGFNRAEMTAMYEDIVSFAELEKFMDQKLKNYSSGMQVRLAFSIAIRAQSDILLLDEVLAVGDAAFQKKCFEYFAQLKKLKKTVVLVTHDMSSVERFCDRVLVIHNSKSYGTMGTGEATILYNKLNIPKEAKTSTNGTAKTQDRWGTKRVEIKDFAIYSNNIKVKKEDQIETGDEFKLSISLNSKLKDESIVVGLAFVDQYGANIAGPNSLDTVLNTSHNIHFTIPRLPLSSGDYTITIAIFNSDLTEEFDHFERARVLHVVSPKTIHGKISLFGEWSSNK